LRIGETVVFWLLVSACGGILALGGIGVLVGRYRKGVLPLRILIASVVGCLSFVSYAVIDAFHPEVWTGELRLALLLPAIASILVLVHGRQARGAGPRHR